MENVRAALAENAARPPDFSKMGIEDRHSLLQGNAEVWRCWELPMTEDAARFQDFLTTYVSAGNLKPAAYVQNPKVGGETVYGTFRQTLSRRLRIDGKTILAQGLRRVFSPESAAELAKLAYRTVRGNEILEAFGLGPGEGDEAALIFPDINPASEANLAALTAADLVAALKVGWTYVTRKFDHGEDNTATFTVVLRKVTWNAFVATAPDIEEKDAAGTAYERRRQTWININNGDALTDLYTAPAGATGYSVMDVGVREKGDGALIVTRALVPDVTTNLARTNPSGWGAGKTRIETGIPLGSAAAKVAAWTAEAGYVLERVGYSQAGAGEAHISDDQAAVYDYGTGATVTAGDQVRVRPGAWSWQSQTTVQRYGSAFQWRMVSPSRITAVLAAVGVIANYNTWYGVAGTTLYVADIDIQRHPNGAATITAMVEDFWTQDDAETWASGDGVRGPVYTVQTIRDSDGQPIWKVTYSTTFKQCKTMLAATTWLETQAESHDLVKGESDVHRIGDSRYLAVAVWIESEEAPA